MKKTFEKDAINVKEQIKLLKQRGLIIKDEKRAGLFLEAVSFFRLSPYMRVFQDYQNNQHPFINNACFQQIVELYEFDRKLRLLVMEAIERIEVSVRAVMANHMGPKYGAHWYLEKKHFHNSYSHDKLLSNLRGKQEKEANNYEKECRRIDDLKNVNVEYKDKLKLIYSQQSYACHYSLNYDIPALMPNWAMFEELTFGELSYFYKFIRYKGDKKVIARKFKLSSDLLSSWLHALTVIRNICAHHARLWNKELGVKPKFPEADEIGWPKYLIKSPQNARVAFILAMLQHFMQQVSPHSAWHKRLNELLKTMSPQVLSSMGLPANWHHDPFWTALEQVPFSWKGKCSQGLRTRRYLSLSAPR